MHTHTLRHAEINVVFFSLYTACKMRNFPALILFSHHLFLICTWPVSPRGRGGAIPPPPPPGRGILTPRGTTVTRGALPAPPIARGVPTLRARGSPTMPGYRAPPLPAHKGYEEYVSTLEKSIVRRN